MSWEECERNLNAYGWWVLIHYRVHVCHRAMVWIQFFLCGYRICGRIRYGWSLPPTLTDVKSQPHVFNRISEHGSSHYPMGSCGISAVFIIISFPSI